MIIMGHYQTSLQGLVFGDDSKAPPSDQHSEFQEFMVTIICHRLTIFHTFLPHASPISQQIVQLLRVNSRCACAVALRDDMRSYLPGLLPKFVALFGEAERSGGYELVRPALACLEALGSALEGHLPLLLPALTRLINPSKPPNDENTCN